MLRLVSLTTAMIVFSITATAVYLQSSSVIQNNSDAVTKCPQACLSWLNEDSNINPQYINDNDNTGWTGRWWTTSGQISVCECFVGWPYCPVITTTREKGCSWMP